MHYKGVDLCDFCFEPVTPGTVCSNCGLTHETYHAEVGLLMPGTNILGKYIIGRVLGRGGFGATYLAYSSEKNSVVAIKEYYPTGIATRAKGEEEITIISDDKRNVFEKGARRFFDEAKTISKFNSNKNVVSVYEFFYSNNTVYYSMEYLKGIDLKGYVSKKGHRLSEPEAVAIMKGICDALVTVHSTQTLHRDISPDNIFICTNGDVKLIDFGAAKQVLGNSQQTYSVVVKQGFAPLEQYKSSGKQGVWTDIYAVGASAYYSLTGKVPPDAMTRFENPQIDFDPELGISQNFINIIEKCMQPRVEDRYQSAIELLADINDINTGSVSVGGDEYVQPIYSGIRQELHGSDVKFGEIPNSYNSANNSHQSYPPSGGPYTHSSYEYPMSYYERMQAEKEAKSAMLKGIIIGVCALIIVALIIVILVTLLTPGQQPPFPPNGEMMPPPGGMPPPGMPGGAPPA
ncbi:MAG: serine/threonine protein kinase [Ruminococcaceae bacterium]|nr:serine/threonine protein kinase [Oscillospiraceae bacterium]